MTLELLKNVLKFETKVFEIWLDRDNKKPISLEKTCLISQFHNRSAA